MDRSNHIGIEPFYLYAASWHSTSQINITSLLTSLLSQWFMVIWFVRFPWMVLLSTCEGWRASAWVTSGLQCRFSLRLLLRASLGCDLQGTLGSLQLSVKQFGWGSVPPKRWYSARALDCFLCSWAAASNEGVRVSRGLCYDIIAHEIESQYTLLCRICGTRG